MKLPDVNVLLYAVDESSPHHEAAGRWWDATLSGDETVGLSWTVLLAFVRLTTNPRVFARPLTPDDSLDLVEGWLGRPVSTVVHPTDRHLGVLRGLLGETGTAGNLTTDAHLAALAVEHGAELWSTDSDFARFRGLRWRNPLAGENR